MSDANRALLICVFITGTACLSDFIGTGKWFMNSVQMCHDGIDYPVQAIVRRHKLNRTHDGFNLSLTIPEDVTETSHGMYLEMCKQVDGGCKIQLIMQDKSFCHFVKQYANDNFIKIMTAAGIDPPNCPIRAGDFLLTNYVFEYSELPEQGMYGTYLATFYIIKGEERISCMALDVTFTQRND